MPPPKGSAAWTHTPLGCLSCWEATTIKTKRTEFRDKGSRAAAGWILLPSLGSGQSPPSSMTDVEDDDEDD
jgi:hypothetical protein